MPLRQSSGQASEISEKYRISAHKETVDFLISAGTRIGLISHIDASFKDVVGQISNVLDYDIAFEEDILNPKLESQLTLFENIRKYEGEEINDLGFAEDLAKNFDIYVNDAFSVSHRNHASVSAITKFLPAYSGFLMEKETANLEKVLKAPAEGKTVILGGAKVLTKLPVIRNFLDKAEHILIAGALANTVFKARGIKVGRSMTEDIKTQIDWDNPKIILPKDFIVSEDQSGKVISEVVAAGDINENKMILDIGPETIKQFSGTIRNSKMIIFNGPLGLVEVEAFSAGTKIVLDSMVNSSAFTVIGGGDTLAFIEKLGLLNKFNYVSTGGGAMLEFLAGNRLPGLEALGYYNGK